MKRRKLLQIHEITCSSAIIADFMEQNGWECEVVARTVFDKHKCSKQFHRYKLVPGGVKSFYIEIAKSIFKFSPSLILIRSKYELLPFVRFLAPFANIILQFHGSEIRGKQNLPWQAKLATKIIASTKDITKWAEYYGTPISSSFKPPQNGVRKKGTALFVRTKWGANDCLEEATAFAKKNGLELTVIDRTKGEYIPHSEIHLVMQKHEWYLDLKGLTSATVLSKTAIEFLHTTNAQSPGKVLTDDGTIVDKFETTSNEQYLQLFESFIR
ncbi:MAG: hypothetical protein ACXADL_13820 [Candidatus Thorarchaeota archaeon]